MHEGHAAVGEQYLMLEDKELSEMCQRTILNHVEYMTDPILENVSVSTTPDMVFLTHSCERIELISRWAAGWPDVRV